MNAYALARYMVAATLARGADAGAAVGLVLVAGGRSGGLLIAALTAPHALGPWVARRLDAARDGRRALALAFALYGVSLAATALLAPAPLALATAAVAGTCGPLLTGGLSSRLSGLVTRARPRHDLAQRRAEGWDATSYGVAGTAGPAAVALLAALTWPRAAVLALAAAAVIAAAVVVTLPPSPGARREPMTVRAALGAIVSHARLRRVAVTTLATSFSFAPVGSVIAVAAGAALSGDARAGALLATAFGLGNLAGSLLVTVVPIKAEPVRVSALLAALLAASLALTAAAPSYALALGGFALAGVLNGPFAAATLGARSRYAPPEARAQVFVSLAGAKIAAGAAGTAVAGAAIALGPRPLLLAAAVLTLAGAVAAEHPARRRGASSSHPGPAPLEGT